jgi:choline-sulfatase
MLVRGRYKLVRCPGDPDLLYDTEADPEELINLAGDPAHSSIYEELSVEVERRWDLDALHRQVLASQAARRVVSEALGTGRRHQWDHPTPDDGAGRYLRTGDDFWPTLERRRLR